MLASYHASATNVQPRTAKKGASAEAEHRAILREVLLRCSTRSFKEALLAMPDVGKDADFAIERDLDRDDGLSP